MYSDTSVLFKFDLSVTLQEGFPKFSVKNGITISTLTSDVLPFCCLYPIQLVDNVYLLCLELTRLYLNGRGCHLFISILYSVPNIGFST